jgi:hypothetical protein
MGNVTKGHRLSTRASTVAGWMHVTDLVAQRGGGMTSNLEARADYAFAALEKILTNAENQQNWPPKPRLF